MAMVTPTRRRGARRRVPKAVVVVACLLALACRPKPATAPASESEPAAFDRNSDEAVAGDLQNLCGRIQRRDIGMWSQPMYMSERVLALTIEVDGGSDAARCELGQLMYKLAPKVCAETSEDLRSHCGG
jgi:hypothetical protein